jgi:type VI secretion system secreted protein VgrG
MSIDKDKFAKQLRNGAEKSSLRRCAKYVREALEAGGATTTGHPAAAKDYGPLLLRNGYHAIASDNPATYMPMKGDVVVMQPTSSGNAAGHIEGYDGTDWISDFVQSGFWPGSAYRKEKPRYVIYRY